AYGYVDMRPDIPNTVVLNQRVVMCSLIFFVVIRLPPTSTLFPYTTLFRSSVIDSLAAHPALPTPAFTPFCCGAFPSQCPLTWARSEEHTSELQSRFELVCRLLLEKKNTEF